MNTCILLTEIILSAVINNNYIFCYSGQPFSDYYDGKTVKGTVGFSINFTWTIRKSFTRVEWGLALSPNAFDSPPQLLVSFFQGNTFSVTPPPAYTGRVSGNIAGSHVSFTLKNLRKEDGRLYGCRIMDDGSADLQSSFDSVKLAVEGRHSCFVVILCNPIQ